MPGPPKPTGLRLVVGKADGVNQHIGALGGFNRAADRGLAAVIDAVREQDDRFAPLLLLEELVRGEENGIVHRRAAALRGLAAALRRPPPPR